MQKRIGVIVGSLRKGAYTRMMSRAVRELAPPSFSLFEIGIGELPLYNQDLETATPPEAWKSFRAEVKQADALLFITPEYNRSVPGALKNAIDVGSRPKGSNVWSGKPSAIISLTPGGLGAMAASQQLRLALSAVNSPVLPIPEAYIANAGSLFDESGKLTKAETREYVAKFLVQFETWMEKLT